MLDLVQLSNLRFGMSVVPEMGGSPGTYQERWTQWFLEQSFFRDFVYRNPRGRKKGQELADAVVLFDDVALLVQVKAQCGAHIPTSWATEALLKALSQVRKTHEALNDGSIKKLKNDFYGDLEFRPASFPNQIGIIVLAQDSTTPYIAAKLVPGLLSATFPIHVFSLDDFRKITQRFDTAGDFVTFLELRGDIAQSLFVHDEIGNIRRMLPHVKDVLRKYSPGMTDESLNKTYRAFEEKATGNLMGSPDWKYGLSIDDMIAHSHDVDPDLPWNKSQADRTAALDVAKFLGWLTRDRRIKLGKKVVLMCEAARDGQGHYFHHRKPSRGTGCIFLATSQSRADRLAYLKFLVSYAHMKYELQQCLGVATNPIGSGRAYDFIITSQPPPTALVQELKTFDDPFSADMPL